MKQAKQQIARFPSCYSMSRRSPAQCRWKPWRFV